MALRARSSATNRRSSEGSGSIVPSRSKNAATRVPDSELLKPTRRIRCRVIPNLESPDSRSCRLPRGANRTHRANGAHRYRHAVQLHPVQLRPADRALAVRDELPALDQNRNRAHKAKHRRCRRQRDRAAANRGVRLRREPAESTPPVRASAPTRARDSRSTRHFIAAYKSTAPARTDQRSPPPRLQHRVRAPAGIARLRRKPAQKIGRCAARKKENRQPQRNHSYDREIREVNVLDHAVAENVDLRANRRRQIFSPRDDGHRARLTQCTQRSARRRSD